MVITITRNYFARDICRGSLTIDGYPEYGLLTLEAALPRNLENYIGHALPPGEYPCTVDILPVIYKGVTLRLPWIILKDIAWFPRAQFAQSNNGNAPRRGQIFLGAEYADNGFSIVNPDDEAMKVWARISARVREKGEDVTLVVRNEEGIVFEDTYRDKARIEAEERAKNALRDSLTNELMGICGT